METLADKDQHSAIGTLRRVAKNQDETVSIPTERNSQGPRFHRVNIRAKGFTRPHAGC